VPAAKVVITLTDTGVSRSMSTNSNGYFVFSNLENGAYRITVEQPGFQTAVRERVEVFVNSTIRVDPAARKIQGIQSKLAVHINQETMRADRARHEHQFGELKDTLTSFVIAQLEAESEIEWWQLRSQLIRVLGTRYDERTPDHFHEPPCVFRVERVKKEDPIVWALACTGDGFYGLSGSRTVVEAYVVENGKARLQEEAGRKWMATGLEPLAELHFNFDPRQTPVEQRP
jgi:carboxypeptidase family protein